MGCWAKWNVLDPGEVALPGGKAEEGDRDYADTATREAKEEIGLDTSLVEVVAVLEPFLSKVSKYVLRCTCIFAYLGLCLSRRMYNFK